MEVFDKKHQLPVSQDMDNYFAYTLSPQTDLVKQSLNLPVAVPIFKLAYTIDGGQRVINIYPTLQFLYSHHIMPDYISKEVRLALVGVGWRWLALTEIGWHWLVLFRRLVTDWLPTSCRVP